MSGADPADAGASSLCWTTKCRKIGRDPATHAPVRDGRPPYRCRPGRARARVQTAGHGRDSGTDAVAGWNEHRPRWIVGRHDQARVMVAHFAAAGAEPDHDAGPAAAATTGMIELAARELIGQSLRRGPRAAGFPAPSLGAAHPAGIATSELALRGDAGTRPGAAGAAPRISPIRRRPVAEPRPAPPSASSGTGP